MQQLVDGKLELGRMAAGLGSAGLGRLGCMIQAFAQVVERDSSKFAVPDKVGRIDLVGAGVDFGLRDGITELGDILVGAEVEAGMFGTEPWGRMAV